MGILRIGAFALGVGMSSFADKAETKLGGWVKTRSRLERYVSPERQRVQ